MSIEKLASPSGTWRGAPTSRNSRFVAAHKRPPFQPYTTSDSSPYQDFEQGEPTKGRSMLFIGRCVKAIRGPKAGLHGRNVVVRDVTDVSAGIRRCTSAR